MVMEIPIRLREDFKNIRSAWDSEEDEALSDVQWALLESYTFLLFQASLKLNLVSAVDREVLASRHLWRALSMVPFIKPIPNTTILDVGSGSGIPAIPLKICFPDSCFYLVESRRRRANFLRNVIRRLGLKDAIVINSRVEAWEEDVVADVVTARSVANPQTIQNWVAKHVHEKTILVCTLDQKSEIATEGAKNVLLENGAEKMRVGIVPF